MPFLYMSCVCRDFCMPSECIGPCVYRIVGNFHGRIYYGLGKNNVQKNFEKNFLHKNYLFSCTPCLKGNSQGG